MRIVLVEPYHGGSHAAWANGYAAHSRHDVSVISHAAQFWKWRMRGSHLTLAELLAQDVSDHGPPDVILVSSMTDVAAFAGAIRHDAPGVPIVSFFHESQFTYPLSPLDRPDATYAMTNWTTAVASDLVIFNSEYHRRVFSDGARRLLESYPDRTHVHRLDAVIEAAIVLPVGIDLQALTRSRPLSEGAPLVVWNHRWEHDKGPELLLRVVDELGRRHTDFAFAMCGEVFVGEPEPFINVVDALGDRLVQRGWARRDRYEDLLLRASVVLSTARQEFFGIGAVEGIAAGAHPVLPDRLVYPERTADLGGTPSEILYRSAGEAADRIEASLTAPVDDGLRAAALRYDWSVVAPRYDAALERLRTEGINS